MSARPTLYLDYNATAPVRPQAAEAVSAAMLASGNPSSIHAAGRRARAAVETARADVSALIGANAGRLVFTSGGTEANALALSGLADQVDTVLISAVEHDAVRETALKLGKSVEVWPVDANGIADLQWLRERLSHGNKLLVALMLANNETGVIQPVAEAAALVRASGGLMHVDAVQAAGKIAVDMTDLGADTLAISAHKLGGPQGTGALAFAKAVKFSPLWRGGGQEQFLRSGTENVPGIAGFGAAAKLAKAELDHQHARWRDQSAERLKAAGAVIVGEAAPRLPNTLNIAAPGWDQARQVMVMDLNGVCISAGSACSSGKVSASGVLKAMGRDDLAPYSIRISGGWATTAQDWSDCTDLWIEQFARHSQRRAEVA